MVQFKNGLHENMKVIDIVNNISIYLNLDNLDNCRAQPGFWSTYSSHILVKNVEYFCQISFHSNYLMELSYF